MPAVPTAPRGRTQLDLVTAQLRAIDDWNAAHGDGPAAAGTLTREQRLDLTRRAQALERERSALLARADAQLLSSGRPLDGRADLRAVLAHRDAWVREAVAEQLAAKGVRVVGVFEDGADVAGTVVVEQPELVLVEDRLPTLSGVEVVRRVRTFAPDTVIAVHCLDSGCVPPLVEAGAQAVFTRRLPPRDIADRMLDCLEQDATLPIAVC